MSIDRNKFCAAVYTTHTDGLRGEAQVKALAKEFKVDEQKIRNKCSALLNGNGKAEAKLPEDSPLREFFPEAAPRGRKADSLENIFAALMGGK